MNLATQHMERFASQKGTENGLSKGIISTFIEVSAKDPTAVEAPPEDDFLEDEAINEDLAPDKTDNIIVTDFLDQFVISSESAFMDRIDLILMLKACPKILPSNLEMIKKFKFRTLQAAIIAAQNEDKVTAFEFYDKKNAERTMQVSELIMNQKENLENVWEIMSTVKEQVQENSDKLTQFLKMHDDRAKQMEKYEAEEKEKQKEQ